MTFPYHARISSRLLSHRSENEMYLFLLETRECFRLNEISARIWELLAESGEPEAVVAQLMREYAVDERIARAEIANLITHWAEAKLLTIVEEGTDA